MHGKVWTFPPCNVWLKRTHIDYCSWLNGCLTTWLRRCREAMSTPLQTIIAQYNISDWSVYSLWFTPVRMGRECHCVWSRRFTTWLCFFDFGVFIFSRNTGATHRLEMVNKPSQPVPYPAHCSAVGTLVFLTCFVGLDLQYQFTTFQHHALFVLVGSAPILSMLYI